jgi:hypothetical protein
LRALERLLARRRADGYLMCRSAIPAGFLDMLAEGGSGYHLSGRSAERVVLERCAA